MDLTKKAPFFGFFLFIARKTALVGTVGEAVSYGSPGSADYELFISGAHGQFPRLPGCG